MEELAPKPPYGNDPHYRRISTTWALHTSELDEKLYSLREPLWANVSLQPQAATATEVSDICRPAKCGCLHEL